MGTLYDNAGSIDPITGLTGKRTSVSPLYQRIPEGSTGISTVEPSMFVGDIIGRRSRYDQNLTRADLGNLERERALHQPFSHKLFNSIVGGVTSGILTAIEDTGYILDFENNINRLRGLENVETNVVSKTMQDLKKGLEQGLPIHRYSEKVFDWSDPGFYLSSLKGILDSAVGFAIPGALATKAIGTVQRAARLNRYLSMIAGSERVQQMINAGLSGYITNFGEGKMMAIEQMDNSLNTLKDNLLKENIAELQKRNPDAPSNLILQMAQEATDKQLANGKLKEFQTIAGEEANRFIARNRVFALSDAIGLHNIYKGKGATRAILSQQGLKAGARRFATLSSDNLLLQATKEGLEEIGQNIAQMEGEYQTAKGLGISTGDTPEDFSARVWKFALSDKALLEGLMGFIGGGPQRILTEAVAGNFSRSSREAYRKRFQEQQEQIKANTEFLNSKLGQFSQAQMLRAEANARGEDGYDAFIKNAEFLTVAADNFQKQTTEQLERNLRDIANGVSEEERIANGWDENYQEQAQEQLRELKRMENRFNSYSRYENQRAVFDNRETRKLAQDVRNNLQEQVDYLEGEIETQTTPDPDFVQQRESIQKQIVQADEHINELDKQFKHITSFDYQQGIRRQRKINDQKIKEKARSDKADEKEAAAREKANQRQAKNTAKQQQEENPDADVSTVREQNEDVDVKYVTEPFKTGPEDSPNIEDIPADQIDQAEKRNDSATAFNDAADNLINQLTDELNKKEGLKSQALIEGEGLTPEQARLGLLQNMIDELKVINNDENVTFNDLVDKLVDLKGTEQIEPVFGLLEALYKFVNPIYTSVNNLKTFRSLTTEQRRELEGQQKVTDNEVRGQYTTATEKEIDDAISQIENDIRRKDQPGDSRESLVYTDYLKVESGSGILAYLSRIYDQVFKKGTLTRAEISNDLNEDIQDLSVLDPKKYAAGTKLTLKVEDVGETPVYEEGDFTKKKITWQAKKDNWNRMVKEGILTETQMQERYEEQVPIAVYAGDQKIGYLHETEWINEANVVSDNVEKDTERSKAIRKHIVATREFNTTITDRSTGYLFKAKEGKLPLNQAIPDTSLPIVIGSKGDFKTSRTETFAGELLNKTEPKEGVSYIVLPISETEKLAIPLSVTKLSEKAEIIDTVMSALDVFYNEKTDEGSNRLVDAILAATDNKINIRNSSGLTAFVEMFVNNYDIGKAQSFKGYMQRPSFTKYQNDAFVNMNKRGDDDVNFQISRGLGTGYWYLSKDALKKAAPDQRGKVFEGIRNELGRAYANISLDHINTDVGTVILRNGELQNVSYKEYVRDVTSTPFLSKNIGTEEDPNYIYTIQPVIEMDFSEIVPEIEVQPIKEKEGEKPVEKTKPASAKEIKPAPEVKGRKAYKKGMRSNTDQLTSYAVASETENEKFKRLLKEYSDPDTSEDRKVELDQQLADMYYAPGEMISYAEKKEKATAKRAKMKSSRPAALTEEQITQLRERVEAGVSRKGVTGVLITEMDIGRQQQITDYMRAEVVDELFKNKKVLTGKIYSRLKADFEDNLKIAQENLPLSQQAGNEAAIKEDQDMIAEMSLILDNWNTLVALTEDQISRIDSIRRLDTSQEEELNYEQQEAQNENASWSDSSVFTLNPSDGLAPQIKHFLSGIKQWEVNEKGETVPSLNYLGLQKTMDYQQLYNILQRLTPNLKASYSDIMTVLRKIGNDPERVKTYPFINELITKLDSAPQQVKNQFVSGMTNHDVNMRFVLFTTDRDGNSVLREFSSNRNRIARVILEDWYRNLIAVTAQPLLEDTTQLIIPEKVRNRLTNTYDKWIKNKVYPQSELRSWLEELGITLTDQTFNDLIKGNIRHNGRLWSIQKHMTVKGGLFYTLARNISTRGDASLTAGDRVILDENIVESLARHESDYALYSFSNSHRTGNKTVYSYGQNKFFINRVRELKEFSNGENPLLNQLEQLSFNGWSDWLRQLKYDDGDNDFNANFGRWVFSLEPLKRQGTRSRDNRELNKLSDGEVEVARIGMMQSAYPDRSGNRNRVIKVLYPTASDKTTVSGLTVLAQDLKLDKEANILQESVDKLYDLLVVPEILRIQSFQNKKAKGRQPEIEGYSDGAEQFLMLPTLNVVPDLFLDNGSINPNHASEEMKTTIKNEIRRYMQSLVDQKLATWRENGIGENGQFLNARFLSGDIAADHNPLRGVNRDSKVKAAATDQVFQYLIANAEMAKLFHGDPALYYKQAKKNKGKSKRSPEYDFVADAKETYANLGKRLAGDIAPGYELADSDRNRYTQAFVQDAAGFSEVRLQMTKLLDGEKEFNRISAIEDENERIKAVEGLISEPYYKFDSSDAQEYTTWQEHLYVMKQAGELSDQEYNDAYFALSHGKDIDKKILGRVMQPMKPVYVDNKIDIGSDVERRVYIKSSSFPLLPQLTRGTELENLRIAMENNKIDRLAYSTAVKLGNTTKSISIFDENGKIKPADQIAFGESTIELSRKGFRIQQRVPYDTKKSEITKVTQASKNFLVNMLNVEGFSLPWINNGEPISGQRLQDEYHIVYRQLHELELKALKDKVMVPETDRLDVDKLRKVLLQEAKDRNYPISDQEFLRLDEELSFLPFSPSANRYEGLLNSIVMNRVIRTTMPGKSYVLGSEEGFRTLASEAAAEKIQQSGIIFTDKWTGKLLPTREGKNGERLPAQAIMPWKFRDKEGNVINISNYIVEQNGKQMLDMSKIDPDILNLFAMRIPNQGPNLQSWIEIVGFLPEASGDLMIATKDYVVQMGSDFDVDKLYTYMYNTYEDEEGIKIHRKAKINKKAALQNRILDVHLAVHRNPDVKVQRQISNPLTVWKLQELAQEVEEARSQRQGEEVLFTGLSDEYQRGRFKDAAAGKSGVAVFSLDNVFNAISQNKNLKYMVSTENGYEPLVVTFGKTVSKGDLSADTALDGKTFKSDIITGYQSAAVDNEKEQILDKLNINVNTFKVIKILNQLGFGEEVPLFISQDIIFDYVNELEKLGSSLTGYIPNREQVAMNNVLAKEKYRLTGPFDSSYANEKASADKMRAYIRKGAAEEGYAQAQVGFLRKFIDLNEYGTSIQQLQTTVNIDAAGIGKSVVESLIREDQIYRLAGRPGDVAQGFPVQNAAALIGEVIPIKLANAGEFEGSGYTIRQRGSSLFAIKPKTINGYAAVYGLFENNDLWSRLFPYNTAGVSAIFDKVEKTAAGSNDVLIASKAERRHEVWRDLKSFLYSDDNLGLMEEGSNITSERERLLFDRWDKDGKIIKKSLATIVREVQNTEYGRNNSLISRLEPVVDKTDNPSIITYRASAAEGTDETNVYAAFVSMLTGSNDVLTQVDGKNYTKRDLAQDLVLYSYITGGIQEAVQFVKYIPAAYLTTIPFAENLSNMSFLESDLGVQVESDQIREIHNIPPFVQQYFQHNPNRVSSVTEEDLINPDSKNLAFVTSFKLNQAAVQRVGKNTAIAGKIPPPFVNIRAGNSNSGTKLFRYDFKTGVYKQIDTLGAFGASEYNFNVPVQVSQIRRNKARTPIAEQPVNPAPFEVRENVGPVSDEEAAKRTSGDSLVSNIVEGKQRAMRFSDGLEKAKSILNHIVDSGTDSYQGVLASEILDHMDKLPPKMLINVSNARGVGSAGVWDYNNHIMTLFGHRMRIEGRTEEDVNRVIMHELLHALTGYKIFYYLHGEEDTDIGKAIRETVKDIPDFKLTEKDKQAIRSIDILRKQAQQTILKNEAVKKAYEEFVKNIKEEKPISETEIGNFYGLTDVAEFVTEAMTNPNFQRILNNIEAPSKKTFWQALKERLVRLLDSIGFKVKEGSILEQAIYDTLDLVGDRSQEEQKRTSPFGDIAPDPDYGDFIPKSYMPAANRVTIGPKFREYIATKEIELRSLYQKEGRLRDQRKSVTSDEAKRVLAEKIQKVRAKIDEVKDKILELRNLDRLDQIESFAEEDMATLERIFSQPKPSLNDLDAARRIINIWQRAGDFSGDEPHIFYDPEEFGNKFGGLKEITDKFTEWRNRADEYNYKLIDWQERVIQDPIETVFGKVNVDFNEPIKDVGFLVRNLLDISEVDNVLLQAMHAWVHDANFAAKKELDDVVEELEKLIKDTGLKDFGIFQQTFGNDSNKKTGELVFRWTQSFFDWERKINDKRERVMDIAKQDTNASRKAIALANANREYIEELRKNTEVFDPRILFWDAELTNAPKPSQEQVAEHEKKLRDMLGEKGYEDYYNLNKRKIEQYKYDLEAHRRRMEGEFGDNQAMIEYTVDGWIARNSPYVYAEVMEKGYDNVNYNNQHVYPTNNYVRVVPKRVIDSKDSGFYDNKFSQIEKNESYLRLYNYMFNLLQTMKRYLPNEKVNFMHLNSIPFLRKKAMETMSGDEGSMAAGFSRIRESVIESVRADDLSKVGTSEQRKEFQFQMLQNNRQRIENYIQLKDTEYRAANDGEAPSEEQKKAWREDIIDEISSEKSFDLGRVLKAFANMAIVYKHRSTIEDQMRIAEDIIKRGVERRANAAGEDVTDKYGNILSDKGLTGLKKMMDDFMDVAYWGYPTNRPQGIGKKKVLTQKEKELQALLEKSKEELDQLLDKGKITPEEYNGRLEVIQEQLDVLGGVKALSKYGDVLLKYIQLKGMGWNIFAGFANMGFGFISNIIEASDGRNYSMKSFLKAQALTLNSVGRNFTFNAWDGLNGNAKKIRHLMNYFDTLKESRNELYKSTAPSLFKKVGDGLEFANPYAPQTRSEYFNQAPVMIAVLLETKIKTAEGEEISLWDAYDKDGKLKEGVELSDAQKFRVKREIDKVVKINHGNYDPDSPISAKRTWIGRAVSQFRTWAYQGFAERFKAEFTDYQLTNRMTGENFVARKGRYRSYAAYFQNYNKVMGVGGPFHIVFQLLRKLVGIKTNFDELVGEDSTFTAVDAANMRKNMTEIVLYMFITAFTLMLKGLVEGGGGDDDDKKRILAMNFTINQLARVSTDIMFYTNPIEFERLARNAIPAFSFVVDGYKFMDSAWGLITGDEDILQSGPNKGKSRTWRDFKKLVPGPVQAQKIRTATQTIYKKSVSRPQ